MSVEPTANEARERAKEANKRLERQLVRSMQVHALFTFLAFSIGAFTIGWSFNATGGAGHYFLLGFAGIALSVIFGVFFLDAWGQRNLVRGRNWKSVTPVFDWERRASADAPASTPKSPGPA